MPRSIVFFALAMTIVLLCTTSVSASTSTQEDYDRAERAKRRKQFQKLAKGDLKVYYSHYLELSRATRELDYDGIIIHAEKMLASLDELEKREQSRGRVFRKESTLHMRQYANLAGAYDRKGYCFHAYKYYYKYMAAKNSNFVIVGTFRPYVFDSTIDKVLYNIDKPLELDILDWDMLPFEKCIPEKYMDSMFTANAEEEAEQNAIRALSRNLERISRDYNRCKYMAKRNGVSEEVYQGRKKVCSDRAAHRTRLALGAANSISHPAIRRLVKELPTKRRYGTMRYMIREFRDDQQGEIGPCKRVFKWLKYSDM